MQFVCRYAVCMPCVNTALCCLQAAAWDYVGLSHLLWGLWGLIQSRNSEIDFDYVEYARQRLAEYQKHKRCIDVPVEQ